MDKQNLHCLDRDIRLSCNINTQGIDKIKAIDRAMNRSESSDSVTSALLDERALIASYQFEDTICDISGNLLHASHYGEPTYLTAKKGELKDRVLALDGNSEYLQLPTTIANREEMTISLWVRWKGNGNGQRIFDFGNSTEQYMYLTANASNGKMQFAIKNNGEEQSMDISKLGTYSWKHIILSISKDSISAYVNGELKASTSDITLRPSDFCPIFNYIGRSQSKSDALFKGDIDDLRIYNYALSADEAVTLYNNAADIENISTSQAIVNIHYYTLDGIAHDTPQRGMNIVRIQYSDGSTKVKKVWNIEN